MAKIYTYLEEFENLEDAVEKAIKFCEKHDIMKEFLKVHGSEVLNMLLEEWNTEDAIAFAREESREETREEERAYFLKLLDQGLTIEEIKERLKEESNTKTSNN